MTGFEYQHRIAAGELLRMAGDPACEFIEFDSHEDVLVKVRTSSGHLAEFIQVKGHSSSNWTPSDIYSDEGDSVDNEKRGESSLIAKQLRRAVGEDEVVFRVVTKLEVNKDLLFLKETTESRDKASVKKLKDNLSPRFLNLKFPENRTVNDWIDLVRWHVAGPEKAVDNSNLQVLATTIYAQQSRLLTPEQNQSLYNQILTRIREASAIVEPRSQKRCSRSQLLEWLANYCAQIPIHLAPSVLTIIDATAADAHHRCVGRWLNAGVSEKLANELANDQTVGATAVKWLRDQWDGSSESGPKNFLWVNGQFGSGKSLSADILFQQALQEYKSGTQNLIPLFLEGKTLMRPLCEEVSARAMELGSVHTQGVWLIIDGADERTLQSARLLVHEAASYARAHENSRVLITSSILEVSGLSPKLLPPLQREEADSLLSRLVGRKVSGYNYLDGRFTADLTSPLFVIQCARFGSGLSNAELVERMVTAALERVEVAIQPAEDILVRLAKWQFDHGSPLIPTKELGPGISSLAPVLETRLIERRGDHFLFTLECVAQWFAAQAVERNLISISELLGDLNRLERWQFALAMVMSRADSAMADRIMLPLAKIQPAFASLILSDGLRNWNFKGPKLHIEGMEVAVGIRSAMKAWKEGLSPVSDLDTVFPLNARKELLKTSAWCTDGSFYVHWHELPELPEVGVGNRELFSTPRGERSAAWYSAGIPNYSAWAWQITHHHIKSGLKRAIHETSLAAVNENLLWEISWSEACGLLGESRIGCPRVAVSDILQKARFGFHFNPERQLMKMYLDKLVSSGAEFIETPYPLADVSPSQSRMWQCFSHERMRQRAISVYQTALAAYRNIVETLFPKMAERFPRYAAWPYNMVGTVYLHSPEGLGGYVLAWAMESLPEGETGQVLFSLGTKEEISAHHRRWNGMMKDRREGKPSWYLQSAGDLGLDLWKENPAAEIVSEWIASDLKDLGWL